MGEIESRDALVDESTVLDTYRLAVIILCFGASAIGVAWYIALSVEESALWMGASGLLLVFGLSLLIPWEPPNQNGFTRVWECDTCGATFEESGTAPDECDNCSGVDG